MNTAVKRIITFFVSLFLIVYVGYQAYRALYNPYKTTRALSGKYENIIKSDAFVLRSETVITSDKKGVLDYTRGDGESVAKNGEVAAVYASEQDARNQRRIKALDSEIESYSQIGDSTSINSIDVDALNSDIEKNFLELSQACADGDLSDMESEKNSFVSRLNKKQLATGEISSFSAQITALEKERNKLAKDTGGEISSVTSPDAGYFVSSADGFENAYNFNNALTITRSDLNRLLKEKASKSSGAIGKIINKYFTYIVCGINANDAYGLYTGENLKLRFLLTSQGEIPVTISAINKDSTGAVLVLKCSVMSSSLAVLRRQTAEVVLGNYTGIKIPDSFIHIVNGKKGVYIREGNMVYFRKLDSIFDGQGYTISDVNTDSGYLQVYDEVIENGDDLYDGEVIK